MEESDWRRPISGIPYSIDDDILQLTMPPNATAAAFEATVQRVLIDPRFRQGMGILCDRRGAPPPTPGYLEAVIAITRRYADLLGRSRWAVLVREDDGETFGTFRNIAPLVEKFAEPWSFTDRDEALQWLRPSS